MAASRAEIRAEWLRNALGSLTEKQRFVLTRRYGLHDGHTYRFREIARCMGVYESAVRGIHRRAMKRLNHAGGCAIPLLPVEGHSTPQSTGTDDAGGESVCLSPLIPEHHGLTREETEAAAFEIFGDD